MKNIISFLLFTFFLTACVTTQHDSIDLQDIELMPENVAISFIQKKIPNFNKDEVLIYGFGGLQSCLDSKKVIPIGKLNSAVYANNRWHKNTLLIRSDFTELSACTQGIFLRNITREDAQRLVSALNSIGAKIPKLIALID